MSRFEALTIGIAIYVVAAFTATWLVLHENPRPVPFLAGLVAMIIFFSLPRRH